MGSVCALSDLCICIWRERERERGRDEEWSNLEGMPFRQFTPVDLMPCKHSESQSELSPTQSGHSQNCHFWQSAQWKWPSCNSGATGTNCTLCVCVSVCCHKHMLYKTNSTWTSKIARGRAPYTARWYVYPVSNLTDTQCSCQLIHLRYCLLNLHGEGIRSIPACRPQISIKTELVIVKQSRLYLEWYLWQI